MKKVKSIGLLIVLILMLVGCTKNNTYAGVKVGQNGYRAIQNYQKVSDNFLNDLKRYEHGGSSNTAIQKSYSKWNSYNHPSFNDKIYLEGLLGKESIKEGTKALIRIEYIHAATKIAEANTKKNVSKVVDQMEKDSKLFNYLKNQKNS